MNSRYRIFAGLIVCATTSTALAELTAQPFLSPPRLLEKSQTGTLKAIELAQPSTGCDPAGDITRDGQTVELNLQVQKRENYIYNPGSPDGAKDKVMLRSYGGCLTGPLIDVQPGNTLRVHLDNQLEKNDPSCPGGLDPANGDPGCFNTINLHYHGMHVSPSGNSDNVLLNIAPQTKFEYEVNIPTDHPSGTFWYHAHRHGSTALQVASGAAGALIVRGNRPYTGDKPGDIDTILKDAAGKPLTEQVFLFQQIPYACFDDKGNIITQKDGTWSCPGDKTGVVENFDAQLSSPTVWDNSGRFTSINGAVQPTLRGIAAGEIQRWRFIHGGIHDTVNLQIVPMNTSGAKASLALQGILGGTPKEQAALIADLCPVTVPDSSKPVELVPQFEIAADGLTRTAIRPIGVNKKSVSGGIGSNFLQPGYRSDVLLMFPRDGTYCVLNQAATPAERANAGPNGGPGGQGPNETQLLATVIVSGGKVVTDDPQSYIQQALYDANKGSSLPVAALEGLRSGNLKPWRAMPDLKDATVNDDIQKADFFIGYPPFPPAAPATAPKKPGDPWSGAFGFFINYKSYDPDRIDFTRQVNTTDDWVLTSQGEPHIFHIHVNPFQVMDVLYAKPGEKPKSIFGPNGECLVPADELGLQNQYCGMWHEFKDTIFVQNDYQVLVRTHYDRYIGEFVIHCHILDHEDGGMMTNIQIVPDLNAVGGGIGMAGMKHTSHQHSDVKKQ